MLHGIQTFNVLSIVYGSKINLGQGNDQVKGSETLEKRISLLFGLIGGFFLLFLNRLPFDVSVILGSPRGDFIELLLGVLSFIGLIISIYFSVMLIIDAFRTLHKKQ